MQQEAISGKGAKETDTSEYQVSDLKDIKLQWEDLDFNMNIALQQSINILFRLQQSMVLEMCSVVGKTPI